jgi:lysozyme family protein
VVALVRQLQQDHVHMAADWAAARALWRLSPTAALRA